MISSLIGLILGIGGISTTVYAQVEEPPLPKTVLIEVRYTQEGIERRIKETFPEEPELMLKVAKCEGVTNGVLDPKAYNPTNNSHDRGIFQISDKYHKETYTAMGLTDMTDVDQNLKYARHLYDENGLQDWSASKWCWSE